jgi:hypothetical protein
MLRSAMSFSIVFLCLLSARISFAATQNSVSKHSIHTQSKRVHSGRRLFLVPPPPPYVPSLLPELTYARYYGHSPYGYSHLNTSPKLFKPNKYLTYCL